MRSLTLTCGVLAALAVPAFAGTDPNNPANLAINEVDADQTSTDSVEFLELAAGPCGVADLSNYFVVLYNGSSDVEYLTFDLDGQTMPADRFFVIGAATVGNVDYTPSNFPATNAIQNGQDGVALYYDPTGTVLNTAFFSSPVATPPAGVVLVDAVVYDTADADDPGLLAALTPSGPQVNEDANLMGTTQSIQRCPDVGVAFDTASYIVTTPTPGDPNCPVTPVNNWSDEGDALAGVSGFPVLVGTGDLSPCSPNSADLTNAAASAVAGLFIALGPVTPTSFKGGTLVPVPFFDPVILATDGTGAISIPFVMPEGVPAGTELWVQWAIQDFAAVQGVALSNAILGLVP